jgi:hypothetical protein
MSDQTVFSEGEATTSQEATVDDSLQQWVGEGKKYRTQEDALKSIPHAQQHIQSLEKTLEELRSDLAQRETAEEMLKKLKAGEGTGTTVQEPEDLATLVDQRLSAREEQKQIESNLTKADQLWRERFGEKAGQEYQTRLAELGLSNDEAMGVARKSPAAFMKLMGAEPTGTSSGTFRGTVNPESNVSSKPEHGTYEYWQNFRRENPSQYYSPKIQRQVQESLQRLGEDKFFGRR